MKPPLVSTIIPTFNRAPMIGRAVASALVQCIDGDELIVVDDGSTDDTQQALQPFGDRIRYLRIPRSGAGTARNHGIREARNELIAFLDSDDEWMPGKLQLQRSFMKARRDVMFTFSNFSVIHQNGNEVRRFLRRWHKDPRSWDEILAPGVPYSQIAPLPKNTADFMVHIGNMYYEMAARSYISTITVMARRKEAGEALRFAEGLPIYEDWACFGRLAGRGKGAYLDCETAWNYGHTEGRLTDADACLRAGARIVVLQQVWGADADFLARHGDYYQRILDEQRVIRAAGLISAGRTAEARAELSKVASPPLAHRVLAALPPRLATTLLGLRRLLRRLPRPN